MHPEETHRCAEQTNSPVEKATSWRDQENEVREKKEEMRIERFI